MTCLVYMVMAWSVYGVMDLRVASTSPTSHPIRLLGGVFYLMMFPGYLMCRPKCFRLQRNIADSAYGLIKFVIPAQGYTTYRCQFVNSYFNY